MVSLPLLIPHPFFKDEKPLFSSLSSESSMRRHSDLPFPVGLLLASIFFLRKISASLHSSFVDVIDPWLTISKAKSSSIRSLDVDALGMIGGGVKGLGRIRLCSGVDHHLWPADRIPCRLVVRMNNKPCVLDDSILSSCLLFDVDWAVVAVCFS